MIRARPPNEFLLTVSNVADGTRPAGSFGTAVTPGNNTYSAYASAGVISATYDTFEIEICINNVGIAATATDTLVTIGIDEAGGTSFTDKIVDLLGSCASGFSQNGPGSVYYKFPLRIKGGATIGVKASQNNAAPASINVLVTLRGRPTDPDLIWWGTDVDTYGTTPGSSTGTNITPGQAAEGAYTAIGTLTKTYHYFEFGYGVNDSTMTSTSSVVDIAIGDGTNKRIIIANAWLQQTVNEQVGKPSNGRAANGNNNDVVYARAQCSGALDSNTSIAIYAVR